MYNAPKDTVHANLVTKVLDVIRVKMDITISLIAKVRKCVNVSPKVKETTLF